jgi:hypothetical protein
MIQRFHLIGGAIVTFLLSGCAPTIRPLAKATQVEQMECSSKGNASDDLRLLQSATVLKAEPVYSRVHTNAMDEGLVSGARLVIRPPQGVSADRLNQMLQCHSAGVLLGQIDRSKFPDDPYWLPNAWLDIDVKPEGDNFVVTLSANSVARNLQVLRRATAFADSHRSWTAQ